MRREYRISRIIRTFSLATLFVVAVGCTREDRSDCWSPARLRVVPNINGDEITEPTFGKATVFVFDQNDNYLGKKAIDVNEVTEFSFANRGQLTFISVVNDDNVRDYINDLTEDDKKQNAFVALRRNGEFDSSEKGGSKQLKLFNSANDLFFGGALHENAGLQRTGIKDVVVIRVVAAAKVTVRKFTEHAATLGFESGIPTHIVVSSKYDRLGFNGTPGSTLNGESIFFKPAMVETAGKDEFIVPVFYMLSTRDGEPVSVRLYKDSTLIEEFTTDGYGKELKAYNGKLLDILIDYGAVMKISVALNSWGNEQLWKEF